MKYNYLKNRGFTLIELLVVISIISLLSSIVFSALNTARAKAKDSAIISGLKQLALLHNLEYNDNKSYANLQRGNSTGWVAAAASCDTSFLGTYATNAASICRSIIANAAVSGNTLFSDTTSDQDQTYSIMALLSTGRYACTGPSGTSTIDTGTFASLGCYTNP